MDSISKMRCDAATAQIGRLFVVVWPFPYMAYFFTLSMAAYCTWRHSTRSAAGMGASTSLATLPARCDTMRNSLAVRRRTAFIAAAMGETLVMLPHG